MMAPPRKSIYVSGAKQLHTIRGVASHSRLMDIELLTNESLTSLGESVPNRTLRCLSITNCDALNDLPALSQTSGIKQVIIMSCDSLTAPLGIDETNDLVFFYVSGSPNLESRGSFE